MWNPGMKSRKKTAITNGNYPHIEKPITRKQYGGRSATQIKNMKDGMTPDFR